MEIRLLGPVSAFLDGVELDLGQPQARAVAAMLAMRVGAAVTVDELVLGVYGDETPRRARQGIQSYVSRLRQVLAPQSIATVAGGDGYMLRLPAEAVDAKRCEQLLARARELVGSGADAEAAQCFAQALAGLAAEPLMGTPGPAAEQSRRRLAGIRLAGVEDFADVRLRLGRHADVAAELADTAAAQPMNERQHRLLMLAQYRCGRQDEAVAVYLTLRRVLDAELGVAPSAATEALYAGILGHDPALAVPVSRQPTGSDPASSADGAKPQDRPSDRRSPRQLPGAVVDFTGRALQLDILVRALTAAAPLAPAVLSVKGMGGVGKTTVALQAAHLAKDHFPDGQLFVDLRGAGQDPMDAGDALAGFLRALGVTVPPVTPTAELAALYRSTLDGRRVLVVLDNAADTAQVRPLIPGSAGCAVLVTSRRSLSDLPATCRVGFDMLDEAEGRELLAAVAGPDRVADDPEAVARIVEFCGGLPLALRIAAARLSSCSSWTPQLLAERLAERQSRLRRLRVGELAVASVFELGYSQLTPQQARIFELIGACDSPDLPAAAVAAALGRPSWEVEDELESLVEAGVAECPSPDRYRLHDLLKLFARERSDTPDLAGLLDYYLATMRGSTGPGVDGSHYLPAIRVGNAAPQLALTNGDAATRWAATELPVLRALLDQIAGLPEPRRETLADRAADCLLGLSALVPLGVRRELFTVADTLGSALTDHDALIRVGLARLRLLADAGRFDRTRELLASLGGVRDRDDVLALIYLGVESYSAFWHRDHTAAASAALAAAELAQRLGDPARAAGSLHFAARILIAADDAQGAVRLREQAITVDPDPHGNLHGIVSLLQLRRAQGRLDEALAVTVTLTQAFRAAGVHDETRAASIIQAECLRALGRLDEALAISDDALAAAEQVRDDFDQGRAMAVRSAILTDQDHPTEARHCADRAHALFAALGLPPRPLAAFLH